LLDDQSVFEDRANLHATLSSLGV